MAFSGQIPHSFLVGDYPPGKHWESVARGPSLSSFQADTIGIQNILQGYDAFEFVHVSAANNRQGVQLSRAQTLQRKMKRLVHVDVRKNK
jgi:hypothetical protein